MTTGMVRRESVVRPVAWMMMAMALRSMLVLGREALSAACFGASAQTDAFNVGVAVTSFVLIVLSPLSDVFVPVYVDYLARERQADAQYILNAVGTFVIFLLGLSAIVLIVFAEPLVRLFAPGFSPENHRLAVDLLRILVLFMVLSGLTVYGIMVLTAHKDFVWIGLAPVAGTAVAIAVLWWLAPEAGIRALAWGFVASGLVEVFVLWQGFRHQRIHFRPTFRFREGVGILGKLSFVMLAVRYMGQISEIVDRNLLSRLSEGSIAALNFARNIYSLPFQILTLGITRVVITYFAWDAARADNEGLKRNLSLSIRIAAFFMIPAGVGLIILRDLAVQVLYERGAFGFADTQATAIALAWFSLGLFTRAVLFIAARYFLSRKAVGRFAGITALNVVCHVAFNLLLVGSMGHAAVALSTALADAVAAVAALILIRHELGALGGAYIARSCAKASLAAATMGTIVYVGTVSPFLRSQGTYLQLGLLVTVGLIVYLFAAYVFRLDELRLLLGLIRDRYRALLQGAD